MFSYHDNGFWENAGFMSQRECDYFRKTFLDVSVNLPISHSAKFRRVRCK